MAYAEMAPLVRLVGADVALEILLEGRVSVPKPIRQRALLQVNAALRAMVREVRQEWQ